MQRLDSENLFKNLLKPFNYPKKNAQSERTFILVHASPSSLINLIKRASGFTFGRDIDSATVKGLKKQ